MTLSARQVHVPQDKRRAFLKALAETGNVTVSAERAKVSRRWVQTERKADAGFDEACEAAVEASFDKLRMSGEGRPPRGWGFFGGVEMVVKGTNGRRVQVARARLRQWTPRVEERFLAMRAATCNVRAAYTAAGMSKSSAYAHRKRRPGFAARWDVAVEIGYARVDGGLAANAIKLFEPGEVDPELPMPPLTVDDAIRIVRIYERQGRIVRARARRRG